MASAPSLPQMRSATVFEIVTLLIVEVCNFDKISYEFVIRNGRHINCFFMECCIADSNHGIVYLLANNMLLESTQKMLHYEYQLKFRR